MALDATVGGGDSNSYVTQAEADAYFASGMHIDNVAWAALDSDGQDEYLIMATLQIDSMALVGVKNDDGATTGVPDQRLHFPRSEDVDDGSEFIPLPVKLATYEQATHLSKLGTDSTRQTLQAQGVVEAEFADVREKYAGASVVVRPLCARAYQILNNAGYIRWAGGMV